NGGHPDGSLQKLGKVNEPNGTTITFKPDPTIFQTTVFSYDTLAERLRESAFLLKNITINLTDERTGKHDSYHYPDGLVSFVKYLNEGKDAL
ncbi:MAG: DNA topoisomerase IV subunit B, partial [Lacticaseibacillus paracasei]